MKARLAARLSLGLCVAQFLVFAVSSSLRAEPRPYSIDDYLSLESVGEGVGGEDVLLWEQTPPYDEIGYYGTGLEGAWDGSGASLQVIDVQSAKPEARPLFAAEPGVSYWIDSLSPGGDFVLFHVAKEGHFFAGVHDLATRQTRVLNVNPQLGRQGKLRSLWVGSDRVLLVTRTDDLEPSQGARVGTGRRLAEQWESAWRGGVSVSVDETGTAVSDPKQVRTELSLVDVTTGASEILYPGGLESISGSPDGRMLAGLGPGQSTGPGLGRHRLILIDTKTGAKMYRSSGELSVMPESLAWSADGRRLAFFAWPAESSQESGIFYGLDLNTGKLSAFPHIGLDLVSQRERGLLQQPERAIWLDDKLAVYARAHDGEDPRFTPGDVTLFDRAKQAGREDWFALSSDNLPGNLTSQLADVRPYVLDADGASMVVIAERGLWRASAREPARHLTPDFTGQLDLPLSERFSLSPHPLNGFAVLVVDDRESPGFLLADFRTDTFRLLPTPTPGAELVAASAKSGVALFRTDDSDGTKLVVASTTGASTIVARLNTHMAEVERTEWQTIDYEIESGGTAQETSACLLLPPDFDAKRRYPVVVDVYPTRSANCTNPSWQKYVGIGRLRGAYDPHLLAARGYIVFRPAAPAHLIRTEDGPLGGMPDLVRQGIAVLAERGYADTRRIGLFGFSQGGVTSLWLATQMTEFKAVISMNGWSDFYTHYYDSTYLQDFYSQEYGFTGSSGRYMPQTGSAFAIGKAPSDDIMAYIGISPLYHAADISAPVLLIHSDMDMFDLHQYERMYVALRQGNKSARLLRYWGEGHGPSSPANIRNMWNEIFSWLDTHMNNNHPEQ